MNETHQHTSSWQKWTVIAFALPLLYVLSSGPVIGLTFSLRESTGWDGFYQVMWLYYPILILGHESPLFLYIEWWVVEVFHTVGPG
ncbi:hypothetical protein Pan97_22560 [Bremerella volcania]|uniref:Uncharacterized protein n=1 Tax=Bremerella volcania TaxID=2527984 RepID=A0A518C7M8_9BACT|nr:hypothetical protein [Bremerella volcania]QDU75231.1 hypothetical protein Pan97_22560 [Bremerella volcania]